MIDLAADAPALFATLPKGPRSERAREIITAVETADLLVGALKHLFDLVDYRALVGTPVLVCATGGTPLHGLMPDHQFRPRFAFFKALVLSTSVYALESDFEGFALRSPDVGSRVERAASEGRRYLGLPASAPLSAPRSLAATA